MGYHSDPTTNVAIGAAGREWKKMVTLAVRLRTNPRPLTTEEERLFTGIYRRLLTDTLEELLEELPGRRSSH